MITASTTANARRRKNSSSLRNPPRRMPSWRKVVRGTYPTRVNAPKGRQRASQFPPGVGGSVRGAGGSDAPVGRAAAGGRGGTSDAVAIGALAGRLGGTATGGGTFV